MNLLRLFLYSLTVLLIIVYIFFPTDLPYLRYFQSRKTVAERLEETKQQFESELKPLLLAAGVNEVPKYVVLLFLKDEKTLELFAGDSASSLRKIKLYSVTAASGRAGPKLKEGDHQVPEGIYKIESLNPNSNFYLSLRVGYPNATDKLQGKIDNRVNLGTDIMIHGSNVSIGCVAVGDNNIAEIFHLAGRTGIANWKLLSAPVDLRIKEPPREVLEKFPWMSNVYLEVKKEMELLPKQ